MDGLTFLLEGVGRLLKAFVVLACAFGLAALFLVKSPFALLFFVAVAYWIRKRV